MLVLRRRPGEAIIIAGTITITILDVNADRVKIGITAPEEISILRMELLTAQAPVTSDPRSLCSEDPTSPVLPTAPEL